MSKHYEITVTATRTICVKAENEEDAIERAEEEYMEWNRVEAEVEDELTDPKDVDLYREQGELITVNYAP
jgi:hypothetical protein